ncbi:hypothetical protein B0H11DRAFT_2265746 [Mycena galericulata]|nr:hypothetical protein B0H11DRAFT_2265746 [Mycena galericulata]
MYRTDFEHPDWEPLDPDFLREKAEAWRDATTLEEREAIFAEFGVKWAEVWELPYWNPSRMLVIDCMHCILEGCVHYHCRYVLQLDREKAKASEKPEQAFTYQWIAYKKDEVPKAVRVAKEKEEKQIVELQNILELALGPEGGIPEALMKKKLLSKNLPPLRFLCWSLQLNVLPSSPTADKPEKKDYAAGLMTWRKTMPFKPDGYEYCPKNISTPDLTFIQQVIAQTTTPSWINSVPKNYGESGAGSIKADEWRILATIYLPIALVLLWGDNISGPDGARFFQLLQHSMAIFQATLIVCRYSMNRERATAYRALMKDWVDGLHENHPHTKQHRHRPNVHAAFHLYDFLILFGPVMSWWCFPFERLIGVLQKIKTNDQIGGEMEATILKSFMRGANLRRWLSRSDCPEVIRQFKRIFDLAFTPRTVREQDDVVPGNDREKAHFFFNGVNFSRASTHLGNSLVIFYPPGADTAVAGSVVEAASASASLSLSSPSPPLARHMAANAIAASDKYLNANSNRRQIRVHGLRRLPLFLSAYPYPRRCRASTFASTPISARLRFCICLCTCRRLPRTPRTFTPASRGSATLLLLPVRHPPLRPHPYPPDAIMAPRVHLRTRVGLHPPYRHPRLRLRWREYLLTIHCFDGLIECASGAHLRLRARLRLFGASTATARADAPRTTPIDSPHLVPDSSSYGSIGGVPCKSLPMLLRGLRNVSDAKIGFSLHAPFPSSEIYRILRREILFGILCCDLIGFYTYDYARHVPVSKSLCARTVESDFAIFPASASTSAFPSLSSSSPPTPTPLRRPSYPQSRSCHFRILRERTRSTPKLIGIVSRKV